MLKLRIQFFYKETQKVSLKDNGFKIPRNDFLEANEELLNYIVELTKKLTFIVNNNYIDKQPKSNLLNYKKYLQNIQ